MKHLLILLSILLLSSPVIGDNHKGETLYGWITSSSTLVWKGFGDKETQPKYKGDVENGVPNGLGVITFLDGSKFVGEYKDGEKNGQGTYTFSDGRKYEGKWKYGEMWTGIFYDNNGNIEGKMLNGKQDKTITPPKTKQQGTK